MHCATHAGAYDIAYLRCIPNVSVACPADEAECRQLLTTAYMQDHPVAVRYPRGSGVGVAPASDLVPLPFGKGEIRRRGRQVALLAFGSMLVPALEAAENLDATVANMRFVKPIDRELIAELAREHSLLVSVEENALIGGAGSEVARVLEEAGLNARLLRLGLPDREQTMSVRRWRPK